MNNVIKESLKLTPFFFLVVTYRLSSSLEEFLLCSNIWIFPVFSISPVITPSSHCLLLYWCSCLQTLVEFSKCGSLSSNTTIKPHSLWKCSISSPAQTFGIMLWVCFPSCCVPRCDATTLAYSLCFASVYMFCLPNIS